MTKQGRGAMKKPAPKKKRTPAQRIVKGLKDAVAGKAIIREPKPEKKGRPSLWKGQETIDRASGYALLGYTNDQIAECLGIDRSTLYVWLAEKPDFSDALALARAPTDIIVADSILTRARGGITELFEDRVIKTKEGEKVVRLTKQIYTPPDTQAGIYWLNNRQREHWKHFKAHEHSGPGGSPIQLQQVVDEKVMKHLDKLMEALK